MWRSKRRIIPTWGTKGRIFFFSKFRKRGFKNEGTAGDNLRENIWQKNVGRSGNPSSFPGEEPEKRDTGKSAAASDNAPGLRCFALSFPSGLCSAQVQCEGERRFCYFQALFRAANIRNLQ